MGLLLDEMRSEDAGGVRRCLLGKVIDSMADSDKQDVAWALGSSGFSSSAIARVLNRRGHKMGQNVIRMHRAGTCCCGGESVESRG